VLSVIVEELCAIGSGAAFRFARYAFCGSLMVLLPHKASLEATVWALKLERLQKEREKESARNR
jgi:hypothetical protein